MEEESFRRLFCKPEHTNHYWLGTARDLNDGHPGMRIEGFRMAVQALADAMSREDHGNYLGYALIANLRHLLELQMKDNLLMGLECGLDIRINGKKLFKEHSLAYLSAKVNELLVKGGWEREVKGWEIHLQFLTEWENADPHGAFFRYSTDTEGYVFSHGATAGGRGLPNIDFHRVFEHGLAASEFLHAVRQASKWRGTAHESPPKSLSIMHNT